MASKPRRTNTADPDRADQPAHDVAAATPGARAPARADGTIGATLAALVELVDQLAVDRNEQLELTQTLLSTIANLNDEVAELQQDVTALQQRPDTVASPPTEPGLLGPDPELETTLDGYRALREQTHQAQRHSRELVERAAALSARAKQLIADSQRISAAARRSRQSPRSPN